MMDEKLNDLLAASTKGVLVTIKRDGRPQLSNVTYKFADGVIRISVTDGRAKTKNLLRDPRASFYVTNESFGRYVVAEGTATLSDVPTEPGDAANEELVELYRSIAGEHPDWDEYRAAMITDQRRVVRIPVERIYGLAMD
ncbi:PPOX class F420-dependent oxidoreductase [Kibdelosporangium philippinense]|uniref:PPOX class F420-dependent oxidoreductase n=1 Tax=Kibdelosporangium philippinense TaxID=211113 RepID=A0ABS8ZRX7_9PSEU|nr:PPOX class F420-dependent oxidoreductase [Kibdelosporangium philippinense]MCE7008577.1 PPOX class F420-dependent oxidoreductase [Kibdelosporangium philippinense]